MANFTTNFITAKKEILNKYLNDGQFDFNLVIKMPDSLAVGKLPQGNEGLVIIAKYFNDPKLRNAAKTVFLDEGGIALRELNMMEFRDLFQKLDLSEEDIEGPEYKEAIDLALTYVNNFLQYGSSNWYDWCINNWGTKWNAMDTDICECLDKDYLTVSFDTAWNVPEGIIQKLFREHADENILVEWYDDDYSGNFFIRNNKGEIANAGSFYMMYDEETSERLNEPEYSLYLKDVSEKTFGKNVFAV